MSINVSNLCKCGQRFATNQEMVLHIRIKHIGYDINAPSIQKMSYIDDSEKDRS